VLRLHFILQVFVLETSLSSKYSKEGHTFDSAFVSGKVFEWIMGMSSTSSLFWPSSSDL